MDKYEDKKAKYEADLIDAQDIFFESRSRLEVSTFDIFLFNTGFRMGRESAQSKCHDIYSQGVMQDGAAILKNGKLMK